MFFCSFLSWGQITEGFEGTPPPAGWTYTSVTHETANFRTGAQCAGFNANNDAIVTPLVSSPQTLSFWWKRSGTSPTAPQFTVQYGSSASGPWTNVTTGSTNPITSFTTTYQQFTADLSLLSNIFIRVLHTRTAGANIVYIDDFSVTTLTSTPTITVTPTTLTGFNYLVGAGPSTNQTFTASGLNLTANLVLTAPTNYEIATAAGGPFGSTLNLTPTAGTVAATTIFVRLKAGLLVGTYNAENIVASSTGATSQNVTCSGTVTGSALSDVIAVASSESATISSIINDAAPLTSTTGIQVWQFKVRDGGATLSDGDNLPTILTALTLAQSAGNAIGTWSDAINTVALFDGATFIASGTVTGTQIQFTGLNVSVTDNTEKTLSLRMSLKCPLGADAFDNEDFGFSLSNTNTTFSASGSGKIAFTAQVSANASNVISVVATKLTFTSQPVTTGINNTMANVVIAATDVCGNIDLNFVGNISITSTGTMVGSPVLVAATAGVSNFPTIVHTVLGTGLTLNASAVGLTSQISSTFDITAVSAFTPGDFAVIALNSNITCYPAGPNGVYSAGDDEISFITFKDIQNGDTFSITDNGYERATANLWGDQEGVYTLTRTGGTLPAGTVITIRLRNVAPIAEFTSPDTAWTATKAAGFATGSLVMNSGGDQIFFMQGGSWSNPGGTADAVYTPGVYLYAFNTNTGWNSLMNSTQQSGLPLDLRCFSLMPGSATDFLEYTGTTTPAAKLDWIARLNNPANWTNRATCAGYTRMHVDQTYSVITGGTFNDGVWTGARSTDWFECSNWQTLKVPDQTIDVDINPIYASRDAVIDIVANSVNANLYGNIAKSKNISITDKVLQIEGNTNNRLDVYGNLILDGTGAIDMDDTTPAADGQINLYGNWTNNIGNVAFSEGNSTVTFTGLTPQIISNVTPEGTETFHNVVINNDFNTNVSNDIISNGNLTVNATKALTIASNDYVQVTNNVTNNGTLDVLNNGSLVQVSDAGVNTGNIRYNRTANVRRQDYVYWSSPVAGFASNAVSPGTNLGYQYKWLPTTGGTNNFGNWSLANETMVLGKGYIVRGPDSFSLSTLANFTATLIGVPNNGVVTIPISRGTWNGGTYSTGVSSTLGTNDDDNWNLVGNPYPSSIHAINFLTLNPNIAGFVNIWTHGTLPSSAISDPFYNDYAYNYTSSDYITYNAVGASSGPGVFNGRIAGGQGFFVSMLHTTGATTENLSFNNSLRNSTYNNSQFFRSSSTATSADDLEKHRIWFDIVTPTGTSFRSLLAYAQDATNGKDRLFDAFSNEKLSFNIFSLVEDEKMLIQGRALPFDDNDQVKIGVSIPQDGLYKIAIATVDGLFSNPNQNIYLEDKLLNTIYDLRTAPYSFVGTKGTIKDRFVIRYKNEAALSNDSFDATNDVVVISNEELSVVSTKEKIANIIVFDVLGRKLFESKEINSNNFVLPVHKREAPLFIEIGLENGSKINKKTVY